MLYRAKVTEIYDPLSGKIIKVVNPNINGGVPFSCYAALPPGYNGVPGINASVLVSKVKDGSDEFWVWHSIIHLPTIVKPGVNDTPQQLGKESVPNFLDIPGKENNQDDPLTVYEDAGSLDSYRGNNIPEIKSFTDKAGNGLFLFQKDADSIQQHGIALRTGNGHGLILEDGLEGNPDGIKPNSMPSPTRRPEPSNYSRCVLYDKHGNRLEINSIEDLLQLVSLQTIKVRSGRQIQILVEGNQNGDILIKNYSKGDVKIKSYGGPISIESPSEINVKSEGKVNIEGNGKVNISGNDINILGDSKLSIEAGVFLDIQASPELTIPIEVDGKLFLRNQMVRVNGFPVATFA